MSNPHWPKSSLRSLTSRIGDGIHGTPEYAELSPYPFINGNNLKDGSIQVFPETKRVSKSEYEKYYIEFDQNTLFLSINGTLGSLAKYRDESVILGKSAAYIKCTSITIDFLYYYLQLPSVQQHMWNVATGSTIKNLSLDAIRNLQIPTPREEDQQKIAAVLSALDVKIDCNNRINAELEAMAKTLYDFWFVQFDFPFDFAQGKPDQNGKPYKSSGGKMTYNPTLKRDIPAGWEDSTIGETFKTHLGGTPPREKEEYWIPGEVNWLSSGENPSTFVVVPDEQISQLGLQNSAAKLLPQGTVILSIVRHIRASILGIEAATNQSVVGVLETDKFKHCFIYPYLVREIPRLMALRTGAQQPHINKGVLDESLLALPDEAILEAYTNIVGPLFLQIKNCHLQNRELTQLRDWLLPMLMNGQVTVK
jgi:type I restriction enzyme S subunit